METDIALTLGEHEFTLRPTFERINVIEEELGSVFRIVERTSQGEVTTNDVVTVLWHCIQTSRAVSQTMIKHKADFGDLIMQHGLASATGAFRGLLTIVLAGPDQGEMP